MVVRRLMPFTALKLDLLASRLDHLVSCAPPNAVYGIETLFKSPVVFYLEGLCAA